MARTDENLEVAMRENSAILLEDDYKAKYEGFDPNSSESYIIFEFMQNKHLEQSIQFASEVQDCFTAANRADRGVRQAGFLVLRKTSMPSVLIELGFISNPSEEQFMRSAEGQTKLASAISEAFDRYKNAFDRKKSGLPVSTAVAVSESDNKTSETVSEKIPEEVKPEKGKIVFKVQILTSDKKLSSGSRYFKGYKNVEYFKEKGLYKYTYGESTSFKEIMRIRRRILKDFKDAFVVAFKDGQRVDY